MVTKGVVVSKMSQSLYLKYERIVEHLFPMGFSFIVKIHTCNIDENNVRPLDLYCVLRPVNLWAMLHVHGELIMN